MDNNPYVGPRPFRSDEQTKFKGREIEAAELLSLVLSNRLVLVYAPSGAGKSSLINTSLVPDLRERDYVVHPTGRVSGAEIPEDFAGQEGNVFLYNLVDSINSQTAGEVPAYDSKMTLSTYLQAYNQLEDDYQDSKEYELLPQVLIIDQFEEIFTTLPDYWRHREDFFRQIRIAMQHDPSLWVVIALRDDYLASIEPFAYLVPGGFQTRFYLQPLKRNAALEAITDPLPDEVKYADGVAEALADDLSRIIVPEKEGNGERPLGQFVEPVQLQVVCYSLWDNLPTGTSKILEEHLAGDVDQALAVYYSNNVREVARSSKASEKKIRRWFDEELINDCKVRELVTRGDEKSGGLENEAISLLVEERLVREESRSGAVRFELAHDRLIEPICKGNDKWQQKRIRKIARNLGILVIGLIALMAAVLWWSTTPHPIKPGESKMGIKLPLLPNYWVIEEHDEEFISSVITPNFGVGSEEYKQHELISQHPNNAAGNSQAKVAISKDGQWLSGINASGDENEDNKDTNRNPPRLFLPEEVRTFLGIPLKDTNRIPPRLFLLQEIDGGERYTIELPKGGWSSVHYKIELVSIDQEDQDLMTPDVCIGLIDAHDGSNMTKDVCKQAVTVGIESETSEPDYRDMYRICRYLNSEGAHEEAAQACKFVLDNAPKTTDVELSLSPDVQEVWSIDLKPLHRVNIQTTVDTDNGPLPNLILVDSEGKLIEPDPEEEAEVLADNGLVTGINLIINRGSQRERDELYGLLPGQYLIANEISGDSNDQSSGDIHELEATEVFLNDEVDEIIESCLEGIESDTMPIDTLKRSCQQAIDGLHLIEDQSQTIGLWRSLCNAELTDLAEQAGEYVVKRTKTIEAGNPQDSYLKSGLSELWNFTAESDQAYAISMKAKGNDLDSVLILRETNCKKVAFNDDFAENLDALMWERFDKESSYIIEARKYDGDFEAEETISEGTDLEYTLSLVPLDPEKEQLTDLALDEHSALCIDLVRSTQSGETADYVCAEAISRARAEEDLATGLELCAVLSKEGSVDLASSACENVWSASEPLPLSGSQPVELSRGIPHPWRLGNYEGTTLVRLDAPDQFGWHDDLTLIKKDGERLSPSFDPREVQSEVFYGLAAGEQYLLAAGGEGTYAILEMPVDRLPEIAPGETVTSTLDLGRREWWRIRQPGDRKMILTMDALEGEDSIDPYLELYTTDSGLTLADEDDDGGDGSNALIEFSIPENGEEVQYLVRARDYGDGSGAYQLTFDDPSESQKRWLTDSAGGREILAYQLGDGPEHVVVVGGLQAGNNPSSVSLVWNLLEHFQAHPEEIPDHITLHLLPNVNPDSSFELGENAGRLNFNRVDLNRNWDCNWVLAETTIESAGTGERPFSEPETIVLRDYFNGLKPRAVIFYSFEGEEIHGGICDESDGGSQEWAEIYAGGSGYNNFVPKPVDGDAADWLASQDIPAFFVYPEDRNQLTKEGFEQNLNGLLAIMEFEP